MLHYIIRRLLLIIPTLIGITFVVFMVMAMSPGGVGAALLAQEGGMRPEERAARRKYYNERYGLDKPVLVQYGRWLNQVSPLGFPVYSDNVEAKEIKDGQPAPVLERDKTGKWVPKLIHRAGDLRLAWPRFKWPNLGESFTGTPVIDMVASALPVTLLLNLITIPIFYAVAIFTGIYSARYRRQLADVATGTTLLALWSIPIMCVGVVLLGVFANRNLLPLFPTGGLHDPTSESMPFLPHFGSAGAWERGWLLDWVWHLVLPVVCLTYGEFAFLSKLMRSALLENLTADFVRTARAKGVDEKTVLFRHVLRNSLLPLITVAASIVPSLLGGSIVVEVIFSLNGMGKMMIEAIFTRDREVILAEALVLGLIGLLSLIVADLLYAAADPRVSYE